MDDFNNFFDDQRQDDRNKTPIYHSPEPPKHDNNKQNTIMGICIVLSVVMCLVIVINVIVLASLKNQIADNYANSLTQMAQEEYTTAINGVLSDSDLVTDIKDVAADKAAALLTTEVGQIANEKIAPSVARIYMYESPTSKSYSGLATAFLITDATSTSTERYLITNAHCARYLKEIITTVDRGFWGGIYEAVTGYEWASYGKIVGYFEGDSTAYTMEVVAYGSYDPGAEYKSQYGLTIENDQADLAILKVTGTQPDNTTHPSLTIVSDSNLPKRGDNIAVVGNPQGIGETNSIAIGTISQTGIQIKSWGAGTFIMTDAAINGGNSGGPLVSQSGYVLGVVESKLVSTDIENMGFVLDSTTVNGFINWVKTTKSINIDYKQF